MHPYFVRALRTLSIGTLIATAACGGGDVGSAKLKDVEIGMSRDSVLAVFGEGPLTAVGADTARIDHGFRRMQYFINGRQFEVLYYRESLGAVTDPVDQKIETPVVLADNKVLGTGWKFYVEAIKQYGLPTPLVEQVPPRTTPTDTVPGPATDSAGQTAPVVAPPAAADSLRKRM